MERPSNTSNIFLQLVAHKVTLQGEIQFVARITFYLLSKYLCCKQEKYLLPLATQKLTEQVGSKHAINCISPCNETLYATRCRKILLVLLDLKAVNGKNGKL